MIAFTVPETAMVWVVALVELNDIFPAGEPVLADVKRTYIVVVETDPDVGAIDKVEAYVVPFSEYSYPVNAPTEIFAVKLLPDKVKVWAVEAVPAQVVKLLMEAVLIMEGNIVKVPLEVAVPPGVTTCMVPVVPFATTAVIDVALTTLKEVTAVPPILTSVAPENPDPDIVIVEPDIPLVGVKEVITGGGTKPNVVSAITNFVAESVPV